MFVLPGVKVQIPNGRNEDGTYKSIFKTVESVLKADTFTVDSKFLLNLVNDILVIGRCSVNANNDIWFDEKTGYLVRKDGNVSQKMSVIIANILSSTKISSFTPYTVDSVLNSNLSNLSAAGQVKFDAKANTDASNFTATGKQTIVGWGMPDYTAGISFTTKGTNISFQAPSRGYFSLGAMGAGGQVKVNGYVIGSLRYVTGYSLFPVLIPLEKNDLLSITGNTTVNESHFFPVKGR